MPAIPAYCTHCGAIIAADRILGVGSGATVRVTFRNSTVTCPNCGKAAQIVDGAYEATSETVRLLAGSDLSQAVFQKFVALLERAQKSELSPSELQHEAAKLDPKLGEAVAKITAGGKLKMAAVLAITLAVIHSCHLDAKLDINRAVDQVIEHSMPDVPKFPE
jgi:predicted RNA-binding Zn-ribbon protein involved in translation (DUF1610 family)